MYSLVLMTALSAAPETPQFNGFFRDLIGGCHGSSCNGSSNSSGSSCRGSCNGCSGGLFHGRIANFFQDVFDGRSCHGSCNGSCNGNASRDPLPRRTTDPGYDRYDRGMASGCTGGGYAYAPMPIQSMGCTGGCFGSSSGCFGSTGGFDMGLPMQSYPGNPGGYAQPQSVGFGTPMDTNCNCGTTSLGSIQPQMGLPAMPYTGNVGTLDYPTIQSPNLPMVPNRMPNEFDNPAQPREAPGVVEERKKSSGSYKMPLPGVGENEPRGTVVVKVPKGASLFVEGREMKVTEGERTFVTPPLPTDRDAIYAFKIEYGDNATQARKVTVKAGRTTVVDFNESSSAKSDAPRMDAKTTGEKKEVPTVKVPGSADQAKITVKLPAGATLFVNGAKNERSESVREFTTPKLKEGKKYNYTFKAEIVRNGLPEFEESKIEFQAGETLTVDFSQLGSTERKASR